jgi:hypothetical protein
MRSRPGPQPRSRIEDKITKCGEFTAWLRTNNPQAADDMRQVTFENGRDYRDFLIDEDRLARPTIANHLKALSALFKHGFENLRRLRIFGQRDKLKADRSKGA